jgi:hypothetical protein
MARQRRADGAPLLPVGLDASIGVKGTETRDRRRSQRVS